MNLLPDKIYVNNRSKYVTEREVRAMVSACNEFLTDFCRIWSISQPTVIYEKNATHDWTFHLLDSNDDAGENLAYHTKLKGNVSGFVFANIIVLNGGKVLYEDFNTPTVSSSLFHEIAESIIDPTVNQWWQVSTSTFYAAEVCDPVQCNIAVVRVQDETTRDMIKVGMCNYVFPAWKDTGSIMKNNVRYDYLGALCAPFSIEPGGYVIVWEGGVQNCVFGSAVPKWFMDYKTDLSLRRLKRADTPSKKTPL
jgi:hypothetical protein